MTLHEFLRVVREEAGITQQQVAERYGCAVSTVSKQENRGKKLLKDPAKAKRWATAYGVDPMVVLSFLPREVGLVHLDPADDFESHVFEDDDGRKAYYRIPKIRLRESDNLIVFLTLGPRGTSRRHKHPGEEIVFVTKGKVRIFIDGTPIVADAGHVLHFKSLAEHSVENLAHELTGQQDDDEGTSEMLIVRRCYESPPSSGQD